MKNVSQLFELKAAKGDIGVEIECEGKGLKEVVNDVWRTEHDGSLRGHYPQTCAEFILTRPIPVNAVEAAIINLQEELKGAKFDFSYRTSVHIHVNVQKLEWQQVCAMLYAYYLLEEPLMTFAGKGRKGNNFCLRLQDAEGVLETVEKLFAQGERGPAFIQADQIRYSAMNIEAIKKYGSLEFRGMEGNIDEKRIQTLAKALVAIREYAVANDTPEAVYERFNHIGPIPFMQEVLGELTEDFFYPKAMRDMLTSFSLSLDLPFAYKRFAEQPPRKAGEYKVGDIISYDEAVVLAEKKGYSFIPAAGRTYELVEVPKPEMVRIVPPAKPKPQVAFDAGAWAELRAVQGPIFADDFEIQ